MRAAVGCAGEIPGDPTLDRAGRQSAGRSSLAGVCDVVEQPRELRGGEVRLHRQAGACVHELGGAGCDQVGALRRGPGVLPHDRVRDRQSRRPLPDDGRLALVRDPHPGDAARVDICQYRSCAGAERIEQLERIVLDEPRPGVVLAMG